MISFAGIHNLKWKMQDAQGEEILNKEGAKSKQDYEKMVTNEG